MQRRSDVTNIGPYIRCRTHRSILIDWNDGESSRTVIGDEEKLPRGIDAYKGSASTFCELTYFFY